MSKNLKITKYFDKRNIGSLPRIFLSSLIVVFFFSSAPQLINFFNSEGREFKNNSKAILAYTLNDKKAKVETLEGLKKGREAMRMSLNISPKAKSSEAVLKFWATGKMLFAAPPAV